MKIENIDIDKLNPAPYNPRKDLQEGDPQFIQLMKSIKEFGLVDPLIVNKDMTVIGGHQRLKIARIAGIDKAPCVVVDLPKDKEVKLNIALNKISGEWDFPKLKDILVELDTGEFDMETIGYISEELEEVFGYEGKKGLTDDDAIPEEGEPISKMDDLWLLGKHRVLCGDATKKKDVERLMDGQKADMVFTDPPYGINIIKVGGGGPAKFGKVGGGSWWLPPTYYRPIRGDDKPFEPEFLFEYSNNLIIWGGNYFANRLPATFCWIIWDKKIEGAARNSFADCEIAWTSFDSPARIYRCFWQGLLKEGEQGQKRVHPTQKPIKLFSDILKDYSKMNNRILDPFLGSGSTLIACEKTDRICYGMEIDPLYCDVIIKRWEDFTGAKAVLAK